VHNRRNATRLYKPANIAWLGEGKATFSPADNRFVLVDSYQNNPMHLIVWDLARNDTLTVGAWAQVSRMMSRSDSMLCGGQAPGLHCAGGQAAGHALCAVSP